MLQRTELSSDEGPVRPGRPGQQMRRLRRLFRRKSAFQGFLALAVVVPLMLSGLFSWLRPGPIALIPAALGLLLLAFFAWRSREDLETTVQLRTRALSDALTQREQLLKEVHHRAKNSLQIVSSLVRMQERVGTDAEETIRRVQAMALVHDLIYTQGQYAGIDLALYTERLSSSLRQAHGDGIIFDLKLQPVSVSLDRALPFALILSEVMTNAIRHAFKEGRGTIAVALSEGEGTVSLFIHDDGTGFNPEVDGRGFGLQLIRSLTQQLDATFAFKKDPGTTFEMSFSRVSTL